MGSQKSPNYECEEVYEVGKLAIRLANAYVLPMALKTALELKVIDIIFAAGEGIFLSALDIASKLPTSNSDAPEPLDRILRLLASYSILKCSLRTKEDGEVERLYGAGPICQFLRNDEESGSVCPLFLLHHDEVFMRSWYHLKEVVLEGGVAFSRAYGKNPIEYLGADKRFNQVFNRAMSSHTTMIMDKILDVYHGFEGYNLLVDVGGGTGANLSKIILKYPHIKGINFDLPHVIAVAPSYSGVEHIDGNMYASVPRGDAIFMKWVLHGTSDANCLKLLKNCWEALPESGKVIVVESILPEAPDNNVTTNIVCEQDLFMLAQLGDGKERTHKQYDALAKKSGFSSCEVICNAYNSWVMELRKIANP